ncbi:hypothetical protein [Amaricoccus solimangrovi]|uniref:Uncharacterized protein n=1 Tax=Amaricoccus solimangrovi TaxID=2589815 RepID=A0A501WJM5_9RHOB|nr:hypothetical protein [Amaricoccus solimangrovi]TPE47231.1 hypothetical protein FJM51_20465 [Amaricoccus solimangrovi]
MRCVVIERRLELPLTEGEILVYPPGWTGLVEDDRAAAIVASGAGRVDEEREAGRPALAAAGRKSRSRA